jgi:hypothetical protein
VFGNVLLGGAQCFLELGDRGVTSAELVEELDSHRLGEHTEALRDQLDERLRKGVGDRARGRHRPRIAQAYSCAVDTTEHN